MDLFFTYPQIHLGGRQNEKFEDLLYETWDMWVWNCRCLCLYAISHWSVTHSVTFVVNVNINNSWRERTASHDSTHRDSAVATEYGDRLESLHTGSPEAKNTIHRMLNFCSWFMRVQKLMTHHARYGCVQCTGCGWCTAHYLNTT